MHFPFQLRSITSSCPSGAFFRYSHFWLLYGFRIGSDRHPRRVIYGFYTVFGSDRIGTRAANPFPPGGLRQGGEGMVVAPSIAAREPEARVMVVLLSAAGSAA